MASARPILLLELNEVHWPVLDRMRVGRPAIAAFLDRARCRTTQADASARLSPWITWPTLHRGLSADRHGMVQLGQDRATGQGTPIWEEIRARGGSIGVLGALHGWPPIDPGPEGFFVPDTFARTPACIPASLEPLQAMNLALVRRSGRVATTRVPVRDAMAALPVALRLRLSPRLVSRAARQLVLERIDRAQRDARPAVQAALFWEVFRRLYARARRPLAYASFFTNHVASLLHRHWADLFPRDLPGHVADPGHRAMLDRAFDLVDDVLRDIASMMRARPELVVVLASSMGQGAVNRASHAGRELAVADLPRLLEAVGVGRGDHVPGIAMVPQATTQVRDGETAERIRRALHALRTSSGKRAFDVVVRGPSVSITVGTPWPVDLDTGALLDAAGRPLTFERLGLAVHVVEKGTANHVPEGALAIVGRDVAPDPSRADVPLTDVKAMLLGLGGWA